MFWLLSIAIALAAALAVSWPLLRRDSDLKATGLVLVILIPALTMVLYNNVGNLASLEPQPLVSATESAGNISDVTSSLRARLEASPDNVEGWILLGRSYKSMQRYDEAVDALQTALEIEPSNPLAKVELVEARLFASGNPVIDQEMSAVLQQVIEQDPRQQKALWLLGIAAVQSGHDSEALGYWQRLLVQVEPGSPVALSVEEQMGLAQQRLGELPGETAPAVAPEEPAGWPGWRITVDFEGGAAPAGSVLFVIARAAGMNAGPPLAVQRINKPVFPLAITLDDSNNMIAERKLSESPQVTIIARLSLQGRPQAQAGDWQSEPLDITPDQRETVTLKLDQAVN
jgi:cytochrome c-type biogenesis protein CcmH